jgi:hypothetical protein
MQRTMDDTELFIVRVWRHLSQFRASVRRVDADEACLCTTPEQVAQVLSGLTGAAGDAHDGPWPEHHTPTDPRRTP